MHTQIFDDIYYHFDKPQLQATLIMHLQQQLQHHVILLMFYSFYWVDYDIHEFRNFQIKNDDLSFKNNITPPPQILFSPVWPS